MLSHIVVKPSCPEPFKLAESILSQNTLPAISSEMIAQSPGSQSDIVPPEASGNAAFPCVLQTQYLPVLEGTNGIANKSGFPPSETPPSAIFLASHAA